MKPPLTWIRREKKNNNFKHNVQRQSAKLFHDSKVFHFSLTKFIIFMYKVKLIVKWNYDSCRLSCIENVYREELLSFRKIKKNPCAEREQRKPDTKNRVFFIPHMNGSFPAINSFPQDQWPTRVQSSQYGDDWSKMGWYSFQTNCTYSAHPHGRETCRTLIKIEKYRNNTCLNFSCPFE